MTYNIYCRLLAHNDDVEGDTSTSNAPSSSNGTEDTPTEEGVAEAKSLKCNE